MHVIYYPSGLPLDDVSAPNIVLPAISQCFLLIFIITRADFIKPWIISEGDDRLRPHKILTLSILT